jgi:hypothetical protein
METPRESPLLALEDVISDEMKSPDNKYDSISNINEFSKKRKKKEKNESYCA